MTPVVTGDCYGGSLTSSPERVSELSRQCAAADSRDSAVHRRWATDRLATANDTDERRR